jgi:hypothetical protein
VRDGTAGDTSGGYKILEKLFRKTIPKHPLGVPLDADYPIRIAGPFDAFHDAIGRVCGDAQIPSRFLDSLMMRTVDLGVNSACHCG